ncbi:Uncharacterised protein [Yersinia mollaretii]|nr:Uncharacterised protein [Yersinia mollaretii]
MGYRNIIMLLMQRDFVNCDSEGGLFAPPIKAAHC